MCVVVDGYKLFRVYDRVGISHPVAGFGNADAVDRAKKRGIVDAQYAQWHEWYREYVTEEDQNERSRLVSQLEEAIWHDVADYS